MWVFLMWLLCEGEFCLSPLWCLGWQALKDAPALAAECFAVVPGLEWCVCGSAAAVAARNVEVALSMHLRFPALDVSECRLDNTLGA